MREKDPRYNEYIKRRLRRLERKRLRKKKIHIIYDEDASQYKGTQASRKKHRPFLPSLPKNFSIVNNTTETVRYFNVLINQILRDSRIREIYFDFTDVEEITIDALMYLLAIIKFLKSNIWSFSGNIPKNKNARELFLQSGFLKMIRHSNIPVEPKDNIYMVAGDKANPQISAAICQFI